MTSPEEQVLLTLRRISDGWVHDDVDRIADLVDENVTMVLPAFSGRITGKEQFVAGFRDFRENASILEYEESDHSVDVMGSIAVGTFVFEMVYERGGTYRCTGRDLWIFAGRDGGWLAVWRTLLDLTEVPVTVMD